LEHFEMTAKDGLGNTLEPQSQKAWYSSNYGIKEERKALVFETLDHRIDTIIKQVR
jgi:hypothetical protein